MKIVFIADAHLTGIDDNNQKDLVRFLDSLKDADSVVLLGDIFDFYTGFTSVVYAHYVPVLAALLRLKERGVKIVYVEGNHDFSVGWFFTHTLEADVIPESIETDLDGKRTYMGHGDLIDGGFGHGLWKKFLHSGFFKAIAWVAGPAFVGRVAASMSQKSRGYNALAKKDKTEATLRAFAGIKIKGGVKHVILGHSHSAGVHVVEAGGKTGVYANPGSWMNEGSYLLYDDGEFKVRKFGG